VSIRLPSDVRRIELRDGDDIGYALYAAAVSGAEFLAMACGHNDCERPWPAVLSFLQRHQLLDSLPHN
jgi:hypothetical protein